MAFLIDAGGISMWGRGRPPRNIDSGVSLNMGQKEMPISDRTFYRLKPSREAKMRLLRLNAAQNFVGFALRKRNKGGPL